MTSVSPSQARERLEVDATPAVPRDWRSTLNKIRFGYDIAISYSRGDAVTYAEGLASELSRLKYQCFIDQYGAPPGGEVPAAVLNAIRRSSMLVVIGTPAASGSIHIQQEIAAFLATGRTVVLIAVGSDFERAVWFPLVAGLPRTPETADQLSLGLPSQAVVQRIVNAFQFKRRDQKLRTTAGIIVAFVAAIVVAGLVGVLFAQALAGAAQFREKVAGNRATWANAQAAQATDLATAQTARAAAASQNADRQQKITHAIQLANQSQTLLRRQPDALPASVSLAVQSIAQLQDLGLHAPEADSALLDGLQFLPVLINTSKHGADLMSPMSLSPDGRYVAGSVILKPKLLDSVRLLDVVEGWTVELPLHLTSDQRVNEFVFSPDGKYLLVSVSVMPSGKGISMIFATGTKGSPVGPPIVHPSYVTSAAFGNDSRRFAVAADQTVQVFNTQDAKTVASLVNESPVKAIAFGTKDSASILAIGSEDEWVRLWDLNDAKSAPHKLKYASNVNHLSFSHNGDELAASSLSEPTVRIWKMLNIAKESPISPIRLASPANLLRWSLDDKYLGTVSAAAAVVTEAINGLNVTRVGHENENISDMEFAPDGKRIATAGGYAATVWEIQNGQEISRMTHDNYVLQVAFRNSSDQLATLSRDNTTRVWECSKAEPVRESFDSSIESAKFSPDDRYLVYVSGLLGGTASAHVLDLATSGELPPLLGRQTRMNDVLITHSGRYLLTAGDKTVCRWERWNQATRPPAKCIEVGATVNAIALTSKDDFLATGDNKGWAIIWKNWDTDVPQQLARIQHRREVHSLAFDPTGNYLATGGDDLKARIWNWRRSTSQASATLMHGSIVGSLDFSPNGDYLLTSGYGKAALLWKWRGDQQTPKLRLHHSEAVWSAKFDPTGHFIVTASSDHSARIWKDWQDGTPKETAGVVRGQDMSLADFSHNGKYLATVSGPVISEVAVWLWRPADLLHQACERLPSPFRPKECSRFVTARKDLEDR